MLKLDILPVETFDEVNGTFEQTKGITLTLEHSLVSISKWESKWGVPFLSKNDKTELQTLDYVRCMTLTQNVDPNVYATLSLANFELIKKYNDAPMTATTISNRNQKNSREIITSEIIYYWMVALNIPFECQKWHLNRLLMLINVCSIKQQDPKKMNRKATAKSNAMLNAERRARAKSKG